MSQTIAACLSLHQPTTPNKLPWKIEAPPVPKGARDGKR